MFINARLQWDKATVCRLVRASGVGALLCGLLSNSCAPPPKSAEPAKAPKVAASASAEAPFAPEPPMPTLKPLEAQVYEAPGVQELSLLARGQDGAFELLEFALPVSFSVSPWD
ncbi:MAG TPA: hypothetical protein VGF76_05945, partial [Polyangiaceae bacterium]